MIDLLFVALFQAGAGAVAAASPEPIPAIERPDGAPGASGGESAVPSVSGVSVPSPEIQAADDAEGRVCRRESVTGSRTSRRMVCTTRIQREQARQDATRITNAGGRTGLPTAGTNN